MGAVKEIVTARGATHAELTVVGKRGREVGGSGPRHFPPPNRPRRLFRAR